MGDQRSKDKVENAKTGKENFPEEHVLSPIEEETESLVSSRGNSIDFVVNDLEEANYRAGKLQYNNCRRAARNPGQSRNSCFQADAMENTKSSSALESTSEDSENAGKFYSINNKKIHNTHGRLVEASGDNDEVCSRARGRSWKMSVKWLKCRLSQCERMIVALKKQLGLEKFQSRQLALQCHEKCAETYGALMNDIQIWKSNLEGKVMGQIVRCQQEERKRLHDEILRVTGIYSQDITKNLQKSIHDWQAEDTRRLAELMQKEKSRRDLETKETRKVYENIQSHLENLEKRNRAAYLSFRRQIDQWERRMRDEVARLRENHLMDPRQQPRPWHTDQNALRCAASTVRSPNRAESSSHGQRIASKEQERKVLEEDLLTKLRETNAKDARKTEILKTIIHGQCDRNANDRIKEVWPAYDQFRQSRYLDRQYQPRNYGRICDVEEEPDSEEVTTDFAETGNIATNTDLEDEERSEYPVDG